MTLYTTNSQINTPPQCSWTPTKPQDGPEMSPNEPFDHKILSMFLDAANACYFMRPTYASTSPLNALGHRPLGRVLGKARVALPLDEFWQVGRDPVRLDVVRRDAAPATLRRRRDALGVRGERGKDEPVR